MGMSIQSGLMGQQGAFSGAGIPNAQHQIHGVAQQQHQQQAQSRRPMTLQEIRDRALVIQSTIKDMENELTSIPRHSKSEAEYVAEITKAPLSLLGRKQLLSKLFQAMQVMNSQGLERVSMEWVIGLPLTGPSLTQGNNSNLNIPSSFSTSFAQPSMPSGHQHWFQYPGSPAINGVLNPSQFPTNFTQVMNPPSTNSSVPVIFPRTPFQPLNAQMFQTLFARWCAEHNVLEDDALLTFEGLPIDLYGLHTAVMRAGGVQRVRLFIHFHGPLRFSVLLAQ